MHRDRSLERPSQSGRGPQTDDAQTCLFSREEEKTERERKPHKKEGGLPVP